MGRPPEAIPDTELFYFYYGPPSTHQENIHGPFTASSFRPLIGSFPDATRVRFTDNQSLIGKWVTCETTMGYLKSSGPYFPMRLSQLVTREFAITNNVHGKAIFETVMSENGMKNEWIEPYEDVALLRTLLSTPHRGGDGKQKKSLGSSGVSVGQKRSAPMEKEGTVPERKVKVKKNPRLGRVTAGELNWPELDWSDFKLDSSPESVQDDTPKDENLQEVQQPMFFEVLDAPYKRYSVDSLMIQRIMNDHHYADIKKAPPSNQIFNVGKTENKHILYSKYIPRKYLTDCGSFPSFFNRPVNDVPMDVDIPRGNPSASLNGSNGMAHSTHARDHQNKNTRPQLDSENGRMELPPSPLKLPGPSSKLFGRISFPRAENSLKPTPADPIDIDVFSK